MNDFYQALFFLAESLTTYLNFQVQPIVGWKYFLVNILPVVTPLSVIIGGMFAYKKYSYYKKRDINVQLLKEVYSPLYAYIVKQETYRHIARPKTSYKDSPIIEIWKEKINQTADQKGLSYTQYIEPVCGCTREEFITVLKKVDIGLAPHKLFTLLNMYEMLIFLTGGNEVTPEMIESRQLLHKIESALRGEIICGYKDVVKKLSVDKNFEDDLYKLTDEQLEILFVSSEEDKQRLTNGFYTHPEMFPKQKS